MKDLIDVEKVAKLARIELSEEDKVALKKDLPIIVEYVAKLAEVDTSKIELREYLTDHKSQLRADVVDERAEERTAVINSFPKKTGDALEVPAVFE